MEIISIELSNKTMFMPLRSVDQEEKIVLVSTHGSLTLLIRIVYTTLLMRVSANIGPHYQGFDEGSSRRCDFHLNT